MIKACETKKLERVYYPCLTNELRIDTDKRQIANTIFTIATGEWEKNCGKVKCCICTSGCNLSCSLSEALSKKTTAENMVDELNNKIADSESERYLKDV